MKPGTTIDPMRLQSPVFLPHWQAKVKIRCRRCPENWCFFHFFLDASLCFCSYYLLCNLCIICRICRSTWKMCMCCIRIRAFVRWFLGGHVVHVACRKALIVSLSQKKNIASRWKTASIDQHMRLGVFSFRLRCEMPGLPIAGSGCLCKHRPMTSIDIIEIIDVAWHRVCILNILLRYWSFRCGNGNQIQSARTLCRILSGLAWQWCTEVRL